jgi:hypothetical protein
VDRRTDPAPSTGPPLSTIHPRRPSGRTPARWLLAAGTAGTLLLAFPTVLPAAATVVGPDEAALPAAAKAEPPSAPSPGKLLVRLPWGDGPGEVGLAAPAEGLTRGPEALVAAPDGALIVLDAVNHRLVVLDTAGAFVRAIPVPLAAPRFLAADDKRIVVLDPDEDRAVFIVDREGRPLSRLDIEPPADPVTGLFLDGGRVLLEMGHDRTVTLPDIGSKVPGRRLSLSDLPGENGRPADGRRHVNARFAQGGPAHIEVRDDTGRSNPRTVDLQLPQAVDHLVALAGDGQGRVVVGARLLRRGDGAATESASRPGSMPPTNDDPAFLVARIPTGHPDTDSSDAPASAGTLLLRESHFAETGEPFSFGPDGAVLQPFPETEGYAILIHHFPEEVQ